MRITFVLSLINYMVCRVTMNKETTPPKRMYMLKANFLAVIKRVVS